MFVSDYVPQLIVWVDEAFDSRSCVSMNLPSVDTKTKSMTELLELTYYVAVILWCTKHCIIFVYFCF